MLRTLIASAILLSPSAFAQEASHADHDMSSMPNMDHSTMDHSQMDHSAMGHGGMTGAPGNYPMSREGSGTGWVPEAAAHHGVMTAFGDWMIMTHATLDGVYTSQPGPRGGDKAFIGGMLMASASQDFGFGKVLFRGMMSPDPFMGKSGYPLLLAQGETADGVTHLIDRQHPHDLFVELSATWSQRLSDSDSLFVYAGLPGEPAFGPPAFMHRPAAMVSPEAPIAHHWFDSTHITHGVVTAGWVHEGFKLEASRFRGREPDEHRYDIETGDLDSTAVRLSWNPTENLAFQASWADVTSPEQLEPTVDVEKTSLSVLYTVPLSNGGEFSLTGAFARKATSENLSLDAWLGEASWRLDDKWTVFTRVESIETAELGLVPGEIENAAKFSIGLARDFRLSENMAVAVGALAGRNSVNDALETLYDGGQTGVMAFVRLKLQ